MIVHPVRAADTHEVADLAQSWRVPALSNRRLDVLQDHLLALSEFLHW
jgi:hypothetical protein